MLEIPDHEKARLFSEAGVPERHKFFLPDQSKSAEWSGAWQKLKVAIGAGTIAVIIGSRGSGKTQMGVCAIREIAAKGKSARYTKSLTFFLDLRKSYQRESSKSEMDVIDAYTKPSLLIIDAIENRSESTFENLLLTHLIDRRYDAVKDTILISNQTEKDIAASLGLSIVDRIHECGIKIKCDWPSFRREDKHE